MHMNPQLCVECGEAIDRDEQVVLLAPDPSAGSTGHEEATRTHAFAHSEHAADSVARAWAVVKAGRLEDLLGDLAELGRADEIRSVGG